MGGSTTSSSATTSNAAAAAAAGGASGGAEWSATLSGHARKVKAWQRRVEEERETSTVALGMLVKMHGRGDVASKSLDQFMTTLDGE